MTETSVHSPNLERLRRELAADVRPVRRYRPTVLGLPMVALGFGVGLGALWLIFGLRADAASLGPLWLWLPSLLTVAAAAALVAFALRTTIPGSQPGNALLIGWTGVCIVLHIAVTVVTYQRNPTRVPEGLEHLAVLCFFMEVGLAIPLAALLASLARRGLALRPYVFGGLSALGAALVADAIWRMVCQFTHPAHVLAAHSPAFLAVAIFGLFLGFRTDRRQLEGWRRR